MWRPVDVCAGVRSRPPVAGTGVARLAMAPNVAVRRQELVDLLWGDAAPASATNLVQTYVARLRRLLQSRGSATGGATVVRLVPGGYRLTVDTDQLDLLRFR